MPDIVLATLNARYIHASFGLRYLYANLGPLRDSARIAEFEIKQRPLEIAEALLAHHPRIVGLGVYIWNVGPTTELVGLLKRIRPDLLVILGGPEVSFETEQQRITALADHVITGEADLKFAEICARLLRGEAVPERIIASEIPDVAGLETPYAYYSDEDIAHRILYVEASRGCPFSCEFCLSSLDIPVRQFALDSFLASMETLLARGARRFKFVDRTFNLQTAIGSAILDFFHARYTPGLFLHFEMIPDRLPEALRGRIAKFPPGSLQFEVGIQTFNEEAAQQISRRQNLERLEDNFRFLRDRTGVHVHADLIVGLPGEDMESFGRGFDRLIGLGPQEIQVGILKRLRGAPIARHDAQWAMVWSPEPPYEILQNRLIDFPTMQRLRRFARYWDLVGNSGNFLTTTPLLWSGPGASPFDSMLGFSDWLFAQLRRTDSISLGALAGCLYEYLRDVTGIPGEQAGATLAADFERAGRRELPAFLRPFASGRGAKPRNPTVALPKRQARFAQDRH